MTLSNAASDPLNPLSSAQIRYDLRADVAASGPGPEETRPFGLRGARSMPTPVRVQVGYCHRRQLAVDAAGRPLIETMGKAWETKSSTDGDEGAEENWGWEEE